MEHSAKRSQLPDGGDGGGGSEDRLSALPDDILIHILLNFQDAAVAGRTSVLSSRWRRLWTLLPELWFRCSTDPLAIRVALESHQAPTLHRLHLSVLDATPESVEAWLQIAARRLSGDLLIINTTQQDEAAEGGALELLCFQNATSIHLELGFLCLTLPLSGVFTRLTDIVLAHIELHGPCMLGDLVSSPRCPALRKLTIHHGWGLGSFAIHSDSLQEIKLEHTRLQQLTLMAPTLKVLLLTSCFAKPTSSNQPVASISAPQLLSLQWRDDYDPSFTQLDNMENLQWLSVPFFQVYGPDDYAPNSYCLRLLRRFELLRLRCLKFMLWYPFNITNKQYLMEDITRLPKITRIALTIMPREHSFGACVFHILKMCAGVTMLLLRLVGAISYPEGQTACPSGCVCYQPAKWKTEELALDRLREVDLRELLATENEAALVKRLFDWAKFLEKVTVTFHCSVTEGTAKEFWRMLQSFSRPGIHMKGPRFA